MPRLVCFFLFLLFTAFTFRSYLPNDERRKASVSTNDASYPLPDEDNTEESNADSDSTESEDLEDLDLQITQPLMLNAIAHGSQEQIQLQQHIFNSLPIEVITPPPQRSLHS